MIDKMTRYDFILLSGETESFLNAVQELGVVDITRSAKPVDEKSAELVGRMAALKREISEITKGSDGTLTEMQTRRNELVKEQQALEPWGKFSPEALENLEKCGVHLTFHCVQASKFDSSWSDNWPLEVISEADGKIWFAVAGATDFPVKEVAAPKRTAADVQAEIASLDKSIDDYRSKLVARASEIPSLEAEIAAASSEFELHQASLVAETASENILTVFTGFAPASEDERLNKAFEAMDVYFCSQKASANDAPPIKFRNNKFVKMFEVLTDMYGRPAYDGFDPTPYISIFFLLFFAMCMGDAGYGILLVVIGWLLKKVRSFASLAPLVMTLGAATIVVGTIFHTFFSIDISQWSCIPDWLRAVMVPSKFPGTEYDGTMVVALIVGIVHLCLAMIVKTVQATKNQGFLNSLSTWGWTLLIVGGVVLAVLAILKVFSPAVVKIAVIVLGCVSALGIFFLNNLHRNPLLNVGAGLWETYNTATGILGDVLSYLRLYALGLAGGMLGFAFNDLGAMALGDGGLRWIPFILIVVVGHTLNIAMAALGAFVHPLRLNFLEFFKNSGYEGSGRKYKPLAK